MKIKETLIVVLSDMHTGSSTALFPSKGFQGSGHEDNLVLPNARQKEIHPIWTRLIGEIINARKGRRMILVNLGDAIDGFHHGSMQESLFKESDQCDAHIVLMDDFMRKVGFSKKDGDELYYVKGTETHVSETEKDIAKSLGAIKSENGTHVSDLLQLNVNGSWHLFMHHGKERGTGQNEGNALRNFLRDVRSDREKDGLQRLDCLWSGHTHGHTYNTHIARMGSNFHVFHGVICPSWQAKTRYAYAKVPAAINSVGGVCAVITSDGQMLSPKFTVGITKDR